MVEGFQLSPECTRLTYSFEVEDRNTWRITVKIFSQDEDPADSQAREVELERSGP